MVLNLFWRQRIVEIWRWLRFLQWSPRPSPSVFVEGGNFILDSEPYVLSARIQKGIVKKVPWWAYILY